MQRSRTVRVRASLHRAGVRLRRLPRIVRNLHRRTGLHRGGNVLHPELLGRSLRRQRLRRIMRDVPDRTELQRQRSVRVGVRSQLHGTGLREQRLRRLVRHVLDGIV